MPQRAQLIPDQPVTLGHIRGHGCSCVLVYCSNYFRCSHSTALNVDRLPEDSMLHGAACGMSRSLLNIAKRTLPRLTLRGVGLASKDAVG